MINKYLEGFADFIFWSINNIDDPQGPVVALLIIWIMVVFFLFVGAHEGHVKFMRPLKDKTCTVWAAGIMTVFISCPFVHIAILAAIGYGLVEFYSQIIKEWK